MAIYIIIFLTLSIMSILDLFIKKEKFIYKFLFFLIIVMMIFIAGTRYYVGSDYNLYLDLYNRILEGSYSGNVELVYVVFCKMFRCFPVVLFAFAIIAISSKAIFIKKLSPFPFVSLLIYFSYVFISFDMGRMRQGAALGILCFGFFSIKERNFFKFLIVIALAFLIQKTSIVFLPVYFLPKLKIRKYLYLLIVIGLFAIGMLKLDLLVVKMLEDFNILDEKYSLYFNDNRYVYFSFSITNLRRLVLLILFLFLNIDKHEDFEYRMFLNTYFVGCCIYYFFRQFPTLAERVSMYYCFSEIILIAYLLKTIVIKLNIIVMPMIMLYCGYYIYSLMDTTAAEGWHNEPYNPYKSSLGLNVWDINTITVLALFCFLTGLLIFYRRMRGKKYEGYI